MTIELTTDYEDYEARALECLQWAHEVPVGNGQEEQATYHLSRAQVYATLAQAAATDMLSKVVGLGSD